ncbi:hypothetical protein QU481_10535 [Crenobacter sp. SG2303]|uniref:Secreted protein n=1 Tax=Crenobacter oryzisoli TaxID=3056844 RepID=A0ABT7XNF7_9NEIS|nr:hypothetical protein [Crenobacter sp. SG2303]MDN0075327.1 hypothetical protein [Crenobacter sp. SG2303]
MRLIAFQWTVHLSIAAATCPYPGRRLIKVAVAIEMARVPSDLEQCLCPTDPLSGRGYMVNDAMTEHRIK